MIPMALLSLVMIAIVIAGGSLLVNKLGILAKWNKDRSQDKVLEEQSERLAQLEKQFGVMLDVVLELDSVDDGDFAKRLLQAGYDR